MVKPILMPKYGLQQDKGTVIRWLKKEGETVQKGEVLLELETDKALFEYESPEAGILRKLVAQEGTVVPVLSVIAVLTDSPEEPFDVSAPPPAQAVVADTKEEAPAVSSAPSRSSRVAERVKSSPAARKRAQDLGIDLATVQGTGPGGRITPQDVEQAAQQAQRISAPAAAPTVRAEGKSLSRMRQAIGRAMSHSKQTIPHFYVSIEVDMTEAEKWRKHVEAQRKIKLSVTDALVKAAAVTLKKFPVLNASLDGDTTMIEHEGVNIGLVVGMEDGLLVPVIADAPTKSLTTLARERAAIVNAARAGKLSGSAPATFTISNLGMFGVTSFIAIVTPPQSAALAVGAVLPQVRAHGEPLKTEVRQVMQVTLSADHRLADGVVAARYLQDFKKDLESVETLQSWLGGNA